MDFEDILQQVLRLAAAQFGQEASALDAGFTAADVATWNSLSHVMLVSSIEKSFGIKFDLMKMVGMKSLEDIARATHEALQQA